MSKVVSKVPAGRRRRSARLLIVLPWIVIAVAMLPLALVTRSSQIQLAVTASRVEMTLARAVPRKIAASVPSRTLTLTGFRSVLLGFGDIDPKTSGAAGELRLLPADAFTSATFENVTVDGVELSPGAVVTFSSQQGELKIEARAAGLKGAFTSTGPLVIRCDSCGVQSAERQAPGNLQPRSTFIPRSPQLFSFESEPDGMSLTLDGQTGMMPVVGSIGLSKVDFSDLQGVQPESSILSGELVYTGLQREPRHISPKEFIVTDNLKNFWLTGITLGETGMQLTLNGEVGRLDVGPPGDVANELPSLLEWIYAQQRWILYVQAIAVAATTLIGALKMLGLMPER